jgi:hypothetical protein
MFARNLFPVSFLLGKLSLLNTILKKIMWKKKEAGIIKNFHANQLH